MKRIYTLLIALMLGIATLQSAWAQPPGGFGGFGRGMGFGGGGLRLLSMVEVQKELKLNQGQIDKAKAKGDEISKSRREALEKAGGFQALRDMSQEDREKLFQPFQDAEKKAIDEILNTDQKKRHHQLEIQQTAQFSIAGAFARKDVAEAMKITDEQKEKLTAIQEESGQAMGEAFRSIGVAPQDMTDDDRKKMQEKMAVIRKDTTAKCMALLTDEQKKTWKELVGEPFKFPAFRPGGPGGPGRPRA